ncbi:FAD-dependent oxidoreductase [Patescibacteria group bacterium]|nr:FAD-dependent oxidoreductase [Patescibacteria group bacterium]MBU2219953.1 FAD-dependent oxidoreductase [Patescibacteria group bacterium]MBU2264644.1 FAD-dependent oxidoreductase [Patescibacteria group bacterium]
MYDLVIIGAGPAGLAAAIYAARKKIKTLVLAGNAVSQTTEAHLVENYPGIPSIPGGELAEKFREHARGIGVEIKDSVEIAKIESSDGKFEVIATGSKFSAKSLIIATGKKYRELQVPGAKEFKGKGITYCATCDAPLFKNKIVAVIGAGDSGQDAAWQLTKYASKIYLLNKYPAMRGDDRLLQEELKKHPKIEIYNQCEPMEIKGEKFVQALIFKHNGVGETKEITVDGIFVEIGSVPASKFLTGVVDLNEKGEIIINPKTNATSCPGIFAAGDTTDIPHKQIIIAAGEGAKAALSVYEYLKNR